MVVTVADLQKLHDELWKLKGVAAWRGLGRQPWYDTARRMTPDEWAMVRGVIANEALICVPHNACMGFNFGMRLYEHPYAPGLDPEYVMGVTGEHLPEPLGTRFDDAWAVYSPFTHNDRNGEWLERYGFGTLREKGHYEY